jgi:hypothetical protein
MRSNFGTKFATCHRASHVHVGKVTTSYTVGSYVGEPASDRRADKGGPFFQISLGTRGTKN